jgi:hypothetical protein
LTLPPNDAIIEVSAKLLVTNQKQGSNQMESSITVGSQFITQKSGVTGTVQEIVQNANGTSRIRLSLANGDSRWTTVK